MNKKAGKH